MGNYLIDMNYQSFTTRTETEIALNPGEAKHVIAKLAAAATEERRLRLETEKARHRRKQVRSKVVHFQVRSQPEYPFALCSWWYVDQTSGRWANVTCKRCLKRRLAP